MNRHLFPIFGQMPAPSSCRNIGVPPGFQKALISGSNNSQVELAWHRCKRGVSRGVILMCHPFYRSGMQYFFQRSFIELFAGLPYHFVCFNFRGFGASSFNGFNFSDDILSIAEWIRRHLPLQKIFLYGLSSGGFQAMHAMKREPTLFQAIVMDSVPILISRLVHSRVKRLLIQHLSYSKWAERTGTQTILSPLSMTNHKPTLFFYGDRDSHLQKHDLDNIRAAHPGAAISIIQNAAHLQCLTTSAACYRRTLKNFLAHAELNSAPAENDFPVAIALP